MSRTPILIAREGVVSFGDASLSVWEEGISAARNAGGWDAARAWERTFKRDVFARIVQTLRRLGWTVVMPAIDPHSVKHYGGTVARWSAEAKRFCTKGDLKADLNISGRHIEFQMFQSVNCPTRPDYEGRYESNKEACMPYVMRLEMHRTRRRIRDYLCNVFEGYTFRPSRIESANPDPLAYFNDSWDGAYEKKRGTHRFSRGPDGWPDASAVGEYARKDGDGARLDHGNVRCTYDRYNGRLRIGPVYGGINEQWLMVYGPGSSDFTHVYRTELFTYRPGATPARWFPENVRRKRQQAALDKAVKAMKFERAAALRDVLHPKVPEAA